MMFKQTDSQLKKILCVGSPNDIYQEIRAIIKLMDDGFEFAFLDKAFADVEKLFRGEYPGYRASNTKYHDFPHTCAVTLASARLFHGQSLLGRQVSAKVLELGVLAALFHDAGLIQEADDRQGTGAKYTIGHEQRSIRLVSHYLAENGRCPEAMEACAQMIRCTILIQSPQELTFSCEGVKLAGFILGSADLLAQMMERNYLEKLPLLFAEFQEGGIPYYSSPMELFQKTGGFYRTVFLTRMNQGFQGVANAMKLHFKARWGVDEDLYMQSIVNQIDYLSRITAQCQDDYDCLLKHLHRGVE